MWRGSVGMQANKMPRVSVMLWGLHQRMCAFSPDTESSCQSYSLLSQLVWQLQCNRISSRQQETVGRGCCGFFVSIFPLLIWAFVVDADWHLQHIQARSGLSFQFPALDGDIPLALEGKWCSDVMAEHVFVACGFPSLLICLGYYENRGLAAASVCVCFVGNEVRTPRRWKKGDVCC